MSQKLGTPEPEVAPLIGRPTRPHAVNQPCRNLGPKHAYSTAMGYIHANVRIAGFPHSNLESLNVSSLQIAYAHRRAINTAVMDIFGDASGAPLLSYDLIKCELKNEHKGMCDFMLVVAIQRQYLDEMVAALSMINAGFCGGDVLGLLLPPNPSLETRSGMRMLVDVIRISENLTDLIAAT